MGRRLVAARLLLHPSRDYCGVTVITTALRIQPIIHAGTVRSAETKNNNKCNTCTCADIHEHTQTHSHIHSHNITLLPTISTVLKFDIIT